MTGQDDDGRRDEPGRDDVARDVAPPSPAVPTAPAAPANPVDKEDDDEDDEDVLPIEDGRRAKGNEHTPSQEEWDSHLPHHLPCRRWCPMCVRSTSRAGARKIMNNRLPDYRVVHLDYAFLGVPSTDPASANMVPILVIKDGHTRLTQWIPCSAKGGDPYVVARCLELLNYLGYRKFFLKSDDEAAIIALKKILKSRLTDCEIALEESSVYDPQSNGEVEKQVHLMQENSRLHLCQLVDSLGTKIPLDHPCVSWLVNYAAFIYCIKSPHRDDGRTPYNRHKLRLYNK